MNTRKLNDFYEELDEYSDELKIELLESQLKRADLDKFSLAVLYESLGNIYLRVKRSGAEYLERAASLFEDCWTFSHINSSLSKSEQRRILLRALRNYETAKYYYKTKGLKMSETRVLKRIKDIDLQLKGYNGFYRHVIVFLVLFSFLSSMAFFSTNITGLSIASADTEQSFMLGGILFFLAIIGATYIIFFEFLYYRGDFGK